MVPAPHSPGAVLRPVRVWVLGAQECEGRPGWYSALDVAIRTDDGAIRVGGLRTAGWFAAGQTSTGQTSTGHTGAGRTSTGRTSASQVAATDFDPATVHHWDFGRLLWVGPSDHPRLVWSNAEALAPSSVITLLEAPGGRAFVAGPRGDGLPTAEAIGLGIDPDTGTGTETAGVAVDVAW